VRAALHPSRLPPADAQVRPAARNQIDLDGKTLQSDAPTRLLYHVAMAIIEGQRLGAWEPQ